ncbi:MAG: Cobalt-precorrin-4 C(11)-methyltransferase [Dehalococcoidia bacterium]|nr:Cobalt-precorrin-4 C(11)-methyltransferase [Bacillota bacterium]
MKDFITDPLAIEKKAWRLSIPCSGGHPSFPGSPGCSEGPGHGQMDALSREKIPFEVIPGVSSFLAAAAALKMEYTLPGVSQTVILTRQEGRTPVPAGQDLAGPARHKASLAIFLSVSMIEDMTKDLIPSYGEKWPAAVIQKASWPDEKIIRGSLGDIAAKVKEEKIVKTALILVGDFLGEEYELSRLYDKTFSHEYRQAS